MKRRVLPAKRFGPAPEGSAETRSISGQETWLPPSSLAGVTVTPQTALCVTAVFACVNAIASGVASMPYRMSRLLPDGGKEPAPDHPVADLLAVEPNGEMGAHKFWSDLVANRVIYGNGYAEITRDWDGTPNGLHLLDSESTVAMRDANGRLYYQSVGGPGPNFNRPITLLSEDVIHVAGVGRDGVNGYNPTRLAETLIGATLAAEVTGASVFGKGGQPVGSLEVPEELDDVGRKVLRAYWKAHHSGPFNAGEPVILENGVKFNPWTIDLEKLQYNQTRWQAAKQIAQLFGVPPHKIGILDNATYGSLEEQDLDFYKSTLRIFCESIESENSRKLFTRAERKTYAAQFDMGAIVRGNQASQDDHITKLFGVGGLTVNDVLRDTGKNPIGPEGDVRYIPANLVRFEPRALDKPEAATPAATGDPAGTDVQALALNGAQIASMLEVVGQVVSKQLPAKAAKALLLAAFPATPTATIEAILASASAFTPAPPAAQGTAQAPDTEATAAVRSVVEDALTRSVVKEVKALRRASKRPDFAEFVAGFYREHQGFLAEALSPSLRALAAVTGNPYDPAALARSLAEASLAEMRAAPVPEAVLAAWETEKVSRTLEAWHASRPVA